MYALSKSLGFYLLGSPRASALLWSWSRECRLLAGVADAKPQQSMLDSDLEGSDDGDDMPETEEDGEEANLDTSDERKRLQAVLAHFDGGEAAPLQGRAQQAAVVRPCLSKYPLQGISTHCLHRQPV